MNMQVIVDTAVSLRMALYVIDPQQVEMPLCTFIEQSCYENSSYKCIMIEKYCFSSIK